MMELIHNKIMLNKVEISNTSGKISRTLPDSAFNFNYIIEAFASADTTKVTPVDTTSTPWTFSIGDVELENVKVVYDDSVSKMKVKANVGLVDINTDDVDLDAMSFDLDDVEIDKTNISYTTDSLQLEITNLKSKISNLKYDSTNIEADIEELSVKEKVKEISI